VRLLALSLFGALLFSAQPALSQRTQCAVSYSQYARLTVGMTYGQVMRVIGCAGMEMNTVESPGFVTITYYWTGRGPGNASLSAVIQNNQLISVFPIGLQD
jgi:hypothetical protein